MIEKEKNMKAVTHGAYEVGANAQVMVWANAPDDDDQDRKHILTYTSMGTIDHDVAELIITAYHLGQYAGATIATNNIAKAVAEAIDAAREKGVL